VIHFVISQWVEAQRDVTIPLKHLWRSPQWLFATELLAENPVVDAELKTAMLQALFRHIRRIQTQLKDVYGAPVWSVLRKLSPDDVRAEISAVLNDLRSSSGVIGNVTLVAEKLGLSDELRMFVQNERASVCMRVHACQSLYNI